MHVNQNKLWNTIVVGFSVHTVRVVFEMDICFINCSLLLGCILDLFFKYILLFLQRSWYIGMWNQASILKKWIQLGRFVFSVYQFLYSYNSDTGKKKFWFMFLLCIFWPGLCAVPVAHRVGLSLLNFSHLSFMLGREGVNLLRLFRS